MTISHVATIGVLMLDTQFPRLVGDIGNPESFDRRVIYKLVEGASPHKVVCDQNEALLQPFIDAGKALINEGAELLTTSCGFLIYFQEALQSKFSVPVITSSLLLFPELERQYGSGNVGIMTISKSSLSSSNLQTAGIPVDTPIGTTQGGTEFTSAILQNKAIFDVQACEADNVNAAMRLKRQYPNLKALLLECTNMPPHQAAIEQATGLKVFSILDALDPSFSFT